MQKKTQKTFGKQFLVFSFKIFFECFFFLSEFFLILHFL